MTLPATARRFDHPPRRRPAGDRWRAPLLRFGLPLGVAAILLLGALWPRAPFTLDVGAPGDRLFLANVNGDERLAEYSYRWTGWRGQDTTLTVPGWGAVRRARATLRVQALPDRDPVDVQLLAGGVPVGVVRADGAMAARTVEIALPDGAAGGGDLTLALRSPTIRPPGDSRDLGVKLDTLWLEPLVWDTGAYWRTVWPSLLAALLLVAALLLLIGPGAGPLAWAARGAGAFGVPLAAALALPWTLALMPAALAASGLALVARHRHRTLDALAATWAALDRPRLARRVAAAGVLLYAVALVLHVLRVPWIGHADYADNAVVARNLVAGRGFSVDYVAQFYQQWAAPRHPADTWPPLQPLLIAPFFALFGPTTWAAKLPNVLVMAGLLWLVFRVGASLWSPRVGILAGLFLAAQIELFRGVTYPLNDLAFTLLAFGCLVLFVERGAWSVEREEAWRVPVPTVAPAGPFARFMPLHAPRSTLHAWSLLGVLGGLLVLSKPSGAVLLAGGAAWALWWGWRRGALRPTLAGGLIAAVAALAVWAPWGLRNLVTFGVPFYSTESYDAWLLHYRPWETIYRAYAWGAGDLPHPRLLVGYGVDTVAGKVANQFRLAWRDLRAGEILPLLALPLIVVGGVVADRRQRALLAALGAAVAVYAIFVLLYWHYELRYTLFLLPWGALLTAAGLWWLHDRLAAARGRVAAALVTFLAAAVLVAPPIAALPDEVRAMHRVPSSVLIAEWLRDNTPPDAVIMSRDPWELSWHSERQSVMIPFDDRATIGRVAAQYGVGYLHLDNLDKPDRPSLDPLYQGKEAFGFRKVHELRGVDGKIIGLVYQFPAGGR